MRTSWLVFLRKTSSGRNNRPSGPAFNSNESITRGHCRATNNMRTSCPHAPMWGVLFFLFWFLILMSQSRGHRRATNNTLPHQAGIELSDFHARGWKSDQGGRNSMQEMHGNQTKCMEFQPIKKSSNFWTSILCPGINFSCSKSLWIWWTIDPLILACLKLMTYASFSTKELLAVLMDGNPCTNGWNSMHQNRKNVIASCFFEQSCLRQVKIQDPWQI